MRDQVDPAPGGRLTPDQLAFQASAPLELIDELVAAGAIRRHRDGTHDPDDVPRVRLAQALATGGITAADIVHEIETGNMPFSDIPRLGIVPHVTGRTFAEFVATLGDRGALLPDLYVAFGLGVPPPETAMRDHEEAALTAFLTAWSMVDERPELLLRAARITGEGMRNMVAGTTDLIDEFGGSPPQRLKRGLSTEEAIAPSILQADTMNKLLVWLRERHQEHEVYERIVEFTQRSLERAGRMPPRQDDPPAIAFVDLSGFTERTAAAGDELAARDATTLQVLAQAATAARGGRVVKLLGDGVMLRFTNARDAVIAVRALMESISVRGLPPAHAGVAAGRFVVRDGDVYGHTVNLAARIAGHAVAGELVVSAATAESVAGMGLILEDAGQVSLKGIAEPVGLFRIRA